MLDKPFWSEVRSDFITQWHEIDSLIDGDIIQAISIDVWKTGNDNEEGETAARVILTKNGDIVVDYHNAVARHDKIAQEHIRNAIKKLRAEFAAKTAK